MAQIFVNVKKAEKSKQHKKINKTKECKQNQNKEKKMNKKHSVKIIKNCAKISVLTFSLIFSLNSFGEKNIVRCNLFDLDSYNASKWHIQRNPDDDAQVIVSRRMMAQSAFCIGKEQEGLELLKELSFMGNVQASYLLGSYYESDRTFDSSNWLTQGRADSQENFDAAIHYYETAAKQIMSAVNYPYGMNPDQPGLENDYTTSAKVFVGLPNFYYTGYVRAVKNILADSKRGKRVSYTDTISSLVKMQYWSEQCLNRPPLVDVWKTHPGTANAMKAHCQARNNFALQVLPLEQQRIKIVEDQCKDVLLHECPEHQSIVNQIKEAAGRMWKILEFVPLV